MLGESESLQWAESTAQTSAIPSLSRAYRLQREKIYGKVTTPIDATSKVQSTFKDCHLTRVFYQDFWILPQFGRTRLGQLLSIGKSGQNMLAIEALAREGLPIIQGILDRFDIQAVAFAPHSVPRKTLFLKEYARLLSLTIPIITFQKVQVDGVAVAQKTLSKLSERIQNARESIFLSDVKVPFERVFIIYDALDSGSTLNEMAAKLKQRNSVKEIYAFAIVGSLKGFDVISEV